MALCLQTCWRRVASVGGTKLDFTPRHPVSLSAGSVVCCMRTTRSASTSSPGRSGGSCAALELGGRSFQTDHVTNVTPSIADKVGRNLLHKKHHPLRIIKNNIQQYFHDAHRQRGRPEFVAFDNLHPVVTTAQNFDSLLFPEDHISRSVSDNYYVNEREMLRAHTSAHQAETMGQGVDSFLLAGDVYRRDEIDRSHYPVFHQMEGVRLFPVEQVEAATGAKALRSAGDRYSNAQEVHTAAAAQFLGDDLKQNLEGLTQHLFGPVTMRWVDCYFPFTHPSWELEILFQDEWLEVLGCGVIEQRIVDQAGAVGRVGWAFGLGLERLAMVLFGIPDIRLFWSEDDRFISQFDEEIDPREQQFKPYSAFPACYKDVTFWENSAFSENSLSDVIRSVAGDVVEEVKLIDTFTHPKTGRTSRCYRISYRHMDRTVTNEEINVLQEEIRSLLASELTLELR